MKYLILLLLAGCASANVRDKVTSSAMEPQLAKYVKEYKTLLRNNCSKGTNIINPIYEVYEIKEDSTPDEIGFCEISEDTSILSINRTWWQENQSQDLRRELVFHEMSHCFLKQDHSSRPDNYMFPNFIEIPTDTYIAQVIYDMKERCHE